MLVLSRKKNESIVIDENIVITVIEVRGDKVRLGIEAPRDVSVHRQEVLEAILQERVKNPVHRTETDSELRVVGPDPDQPSVQDSAVAES